MKIQNAIFLILLSTFLSCKKTNNSASGSSSSGSGTNTGTVTTSTATSWKGIFMCGTNSAIVGGVLQQPNYYMADAYFSSVPAFYPDPASVILVDTVKENGRTMGYMSWDAMYEDTTGLSAGAFLPINFPITWHVAGKNGIPSFTFTDNTPLPSYTGYTGIPDSINHAIAFSFTLTGASGFDYVSISLEDGAQHGASATGGNNVSALTITSVDLSTLVAGAGNFTINFQKRRVVKINGTDMLFTSLKTMTKAVYIK